MWTGERVRGASLCCGEMLVFVLLRVDTAVIYGVLCTEIVIIKRSRCFDCAESTEECGYSASAVKVRSRIGLKKKTYGSTNQIVHHVTSQSKQWLARLDVDVCIIFVRSTYFDN